MAIPVDAGHGLRAVSPRHGRDQRAARRLGLRARRHGRPHPGAGRARRAASAPRSAASAEVVRGSSSATGASPGVALADGNEIAGARRRVSNADAHVTFLQLMDPKELPADFVAAVRAHRLRRAPRSRSTWPSASCPISGPVPGTAPGPQHRGTIHICPDLDYIERAYDDAKYGRPSAPPILECTIPSRGRSDGGAAGQAPHVDVRAVRALRAARGQLG